ncbi:uncharacterized protein SPPG_07008 [Spizellomyces punctatus DAOM BR117]|uniref:Lebercilin domain-containing protein n=1 Tax=Spizellomyces punctatus (strain DAOM BR117) TaxID=645134 RepID=A0A0L0HA39_SPIPD|nr:uncharacterized protein SPPG_07008 [Spizellomyces punctatus DAOM BR117]KNC97533.1 hypothetical protein SPPG_07008 [Spizellomyces punctatus DAOM BR117]|eukprot:XP_016605573.1 hypothetical protein SPPG_07008 [Spizellomyces punctatus DAOM BR117]
MADEYDADFEEPPFDKRVEHLQDDSLSDFPVHEAYRRKSQQQPPGNIVFSRAPKGSHGPTERSPAAKQGRQVGSAGKKMPPFKKSNSSIVRGSTVARKHSKSTSIFPPYSSRPRPAGINPASLAAAANFDEIARLVGIIDEQKVQIAKLYEERRTMKIVNHRQDKAIQQMGKEQGDLPALVRSLNDELRVLKTERLRDKERLGHIERNAQAQVAENVRLQTLVHTMQATIKNRKLENSDKLKDEIERLRKDVVNRDHTIAELEKTLKHTQGAKSGDLREANKKILLLQTELEELREKYQTNVHKLQDRERENAALSIYAQAGARQRRKPSHSDNYETKAQHEWTEEKSHPKTLQRPAAVHKTVPTVRQSLDGRIGKKHKARADTRSLSPSHLKTTARTNNARVVDKPQQESHASVPEKQKDLDLSTGGNYEEEISGIVEESAQSGEEKSEGILDMAFQSAKPVNKHLTLGKKSTLPASPDVDAPPSVANQDTYQEGNLPSALSKPSLQAKSHIAQSSIHKPNLFAPVPTSKPTASMEPQQDPLSMNAKKSYEATLKPPQHTSHEVMQDGTPSATNIPAAKQDLPSSGSVRSSNTFLTTLPDLADKQHPEMELAKPSSHVQPSDVTTSKISHTTTPAKSHKLDFLTKPSSQNNISGNFSTTSSTEKLNGGYLPNFAESRSGRGRGSQRDVSLAENAGSHLASSSSLGGEKPNATPLWLR